MGIIFAGFLVVYSTFKTIFIGRRKTSSTLLGYDTQVLSKEKHREFSNYVLNTLVNLTFLFGVIVFLIDSYTEYGLLAGIGFTIFAFILDVLLIKNIIPREYEKIKRR
ncbi:hypothetical protein RI065_08610 [Mycoplasmatota bacterium zrk1]